MTWDGEFQKYFDILSKRKKEKLVDQSTFEDFITLVKEDRETNEKEKDSLNRRGVNIFENTVVRIALVNCLKSVPEEWRTAIVPKDSEEGQKLFAKMCEIDASISRNMRDKVTIPDSVTNSLHHLLVVQG